MQANKRAAYITPINGVIRIGGIKMHAGKKIPYMTDSFRLTENFKKLGDWEPHNLHAKLIGDLPSRANGILRSIPVKVIYKDPDLNTMERYESYNADTKRLQCAGNGERAQRMTDNGTTKEVACPGPANCEFAHVNQCQMLSRSIFNVEGQDNNLSAFLFRSGGYNAQITIRTRLEQYAAKYGELIRHISFNLVLKAKSSAISDDFVFYYPDLVLNGDEGELLAVAKYRCEQEKKLTVNIDALEAKMKSLSNNNCFNVYDENFDDVEEFLTNKVTAEQILPNQDNLETKESNFKMFFNRPDSFDNVSNKVESEAEIDHVKEMIVADATSQNEKKLEVEIDTIEKLPPSTTVVETEPETERMKDSTNVLNLVIQPQLSAIDRVKKSNAKRMQKGIGIPDNM